MDAMSASTISAAAIVLYRRYDGDLDGFSRSVDRHADVDDKAWRIIDDLRQRAFTVATGRGSESFCRSFEADLIARVPDERARGEFHQLVDADLNRAGS
jgi:hypothetical protein